MALTVYANAVQLGNWLQAPLPDNADSLLRSASFLVAQATNRDPYSDVPADVTAAALADATCAQVAAWLAAGVNPAAGGLDVRVITESKIGTGDVKFDALDAKAVAAAVVDIAPTVRAILQASGLLWMPTPIAADPSDDLAHYGLDDSLFPPFLLIN